MASRSPPCWKKSTSSDQPAIWITAQSSGHLPLLKHNFLREIGHSLLVPKALMRTEPKNAAAALGSVAMALPFGGKMREIVDRMAGKAGVTMNITVDCSSYLQAARVLQSGMCAAVLPDTALTALQTSQFHRIPMPSRFKLCLAWSARNADTRPTPRRLD